VAHQLLDGNDVGAPFEKSGSMGVAELVESGVTDLGILGLS
jgi:hypothetical protein